MGILEFSHDFENGIPTEESVEKLFNEMDFQRACQAYLWGLGPASFMVWQSEAKEKFGAGNLDLVSYATYEHKQMPPHPTWLLLPISEKQVHWLLKFLLARLPDW